MTTKFHSINEPSLLAQVRKRWEKMGECRNSWENVGGCRLMSDFLRYFDTNSKFTTMTISNNITFNDQNGANPRNGLCYFLRRVVTLRGELFPYVTGSCKGLVAALPLRSNSFIVVHCRSISFKFHDKRRIQMFSNYKNSNDMNKHKSPQKVWYKMTLHFEWGRESVQNRPISPDFKNLSG